MIMRDSVKHDSFRAPQFSIDLEFKAIIIFLSAINLISLSLNNYRTSPPANTRQAKSATCIHEPEEHYYEQEKK